MTASATSTTAAGHRHVPAPDRWTTAGGIVALGCTLSGTYVETPWKKSGPDEWGIDFGGNGGWTALAVLIAFVAAAVLGVGVAARGARSLPPERAASRALLLGGLGIVTLAVFWTGFPTVLAAAAVGVALDARRRLGRFSSAAAIALTLAVLAGAAAIYLAFTG